MGESTKAAPCVSPLRTTLLELVAAVREAASSDAETIAVVTHWLDHGRVLSLSEPAERPAHAVS